MSKINFLSILKKAWGITWSNKYLWWFGFLISLSSGGGSFNYSFDQAEWKKMSQTEIGASITDFMDAHLGIIIAAVSILFVLILILAVISLIARSGLIKSVQKIDRGETATFKGGFSEGKKYFWRIFLIGLATGFFILCLLAVLAIPIIFLIYNKNYAIGGLLAFFAFLIFIPILITASFTRLFAGLYAITSDLGFRDAVEKGYALFRQNIAASLVQSLIFLALGLIFGLGILFLLIPFGLIMFLVGGLFYLVFQKIGLAIAIGIGLFIFIPALFFLRSIYETFTQTVWFLFFHEIAKPKIPEAIPEAVPTIKPVADATPNPVTFLEK
jgi:hypothetical protein